nr:hypothetical protein [Halorubellus sp. JP-L1]
MPYPGAVSAIVVSTGAGVLVIPVWLDAVGFANAPALPNVSVQSLVGHVVYGVILGAVYAALD